MKVLIVEDDKETAELVRNSLAARSNTVEVAGDGVNGSFMARSFDYDAIILDNSLPRKDGLTVCKEVRAAGKTTPILFISVNGETDTKISALDRGADDYMTKPLALDELYARLKAVTRRPSTVKPAVLKIDDLELDSERHVIRRQGREILTTRKEFSLLEYMMANIGVVLSRALIMEHVWTAESNPFSNTVEAHVRNIRLKINAGGKPDLIANIPGRGYVMDTPENLAKRKILS